MEHNKIMNFCKLQVFFYHLILALYSFLTATTATTENLPSLSSLLSLATGKENINPQNTT